MDQQRAAGLTGYWTLMRYNPLLAAEVKNRSSWMTAPALPLQKYLDRETRSTRRAQSSPGETNRGREQE